MKVQAHQGDTVDLLCYRHYGSTQNVTVVLEANPGLSKQIFLAAGQPVELPEIASQAEQKRVQLWD